MRIGVSPSVFLIMEISLHVFSCLSLYFCRLLMNVFVSNLLFLVFSFCFSVCFLPVTSMFGFLLFIFIIYFFDVVSLYILAVILDFLQYFSPSEMFLVPFCCAFVPSECHQQKRVHKTPSMPSTKTGQLLRVLAHYLFLNSVSTWFNSAFCSGRLTTVECPAICTLRFPLSQ